MLSYEARQVREFDVYNFIGTCRARICFEDSIMLGSEAILDDAPFSNRQPFGWTFMEEHEGNAECIRNLRLIA
jgi:hypothetical protein